MTHAVMPEVTADGWGLVEGDPITAELTATRLLGGGAAYEAYLAFDEITYAPVVVKMLRPGLVGDERSRAGLAREATAVDVAHHPVVVRGLRRELDTERPLVVLEAIDGPPLSRLIRRHGRLSEQQYLPLALDLCSALHFFAHADVCHLDVKPSNVIMGSPARLIDLSVARPAGQAARLTTPIGTDAYMAPEQCAPGAAGVPGHASDVWGVGATLFHAVAGYRPFDPGEADAADPAVRHPQLTEEPRVLPDGVPTVVGETILAMLAPRPADRPLPAEVSRALEPVLTAQPRARLGWKVRH